MYVISRQIRPKFSPKGFNQKIKLFHQQVQTSLLVYGVCVCMTELQIYFINMWISLNKLLSKAELIVLELAYMYKYNVGVANSSDYLRAFNFVIYTFVLHAFDDIRLLLFQRVFL